MIMSCPKCGSSMVRNGKRVYSNSVVKQRYACKGCRKSEFANITIETISTVTLTSCVSLKAISKTWQSRKEHGSCQVVIPKKLAEKAGIQSAPVVIEETRDGLLIRRLEL